MPRRDLARLAQAGALERVAYGVYRVAGAPRPKLLELLELRAAGLQLAPGVDLHRRTTDDSVISHASAASVYEVGLLEPTQHEFTALQRLRSRRHDVTIYRGKLGSDDVDWVEEALVTVPTRMIGDLCAQSLDGEHLAGVVADLLYKRLANRRTLTAALAPHAHRYGSEPGNGRGFLDYLLSLAPAVRPWHKATDNLT